MFLRAVLFFVLLLRSLLFGFFPFFLQGLEPVFPDLPERIDGRHFLRREGQEFIAAAVQRDGDREHETLFDFRRRRRVGLCFRRVFRRGP